MQTENALQLQEIVDKERIRTLLGLYCRALDRLDCELLKSIYHDDGVDEHGVYAANAHEFAERIIAVIGSITEYGFHTVTHSVIKVEGDLATAESYYYGYHVIGAGIDKVTQFFGATYAREQVRNGAIDQPHEHIAAGRYLDVFARRKGKWKILKRRITNEWGQSQPCRLSRAEGEPAKFDLPGARDRSDPVYELEAALRTAVPTPAAG
jgi:hypothetical protein